MNAQNLQAVDHMVMPQLDRKGCLVNGKEVTAAIAKALSCTLTKALDKKLPNMQGNRGNIITSSAQAVERIGSAIADKDSRAGLGKDLGNLTGSVAGGSIGLACGTALGGSCAAPFAVIGAYLGSIAGKFVGDGIHKDWAQGAPITKSLAKKGLLGPGMVLSVWAVEGIQKIMQEANIQRQTNTAEMAV